MISKQAVSLPSASYGKIAPVVFENLGGDIEHIYSSRHVLCALRSHYASRQYLLLLL